MTRLLAILCLGAMLMTARAAERDEPIQISGIYPHLAVFNHGGECGIGAVVPWADRLWLITYPPHETRGGPDKLYEIDAALHIKARPESVGGTHAARMIHRESNQLIIGPYFIDAERRVRACDVKTKLVGRMTAVARHLIDPANKVYFFDMEGAIYEVNVHTLAVTRLFRKPVPGWHGKGAYTGQGRFIIANNGERRGHDQVYRYLRVGAAPKTEEELGALAEWDGREWRIVERKQFTDVTGPGGLYGAPSRDAPVWAIGWDRRSVILELLDAGQWRTFRLPKGTRTYDHWGGWYTEWPRIREAAPGRLLMDMHGLFYDFPIGFRGGDTAGLAPIATHLRYIPDFCHWRGRLVLAADDASKTGPGGNPIVGQSQSNLWFGRLDDLKHFGPRAGWGGPWLRDPVQAGQPSDPFLINGFDKRCLHLATGRLRSQTPRIPRTADKFEMTELPDALKQLPRVAIARGDYHQPAPAYAFTVDRDVVVYLAVDDRGQPNPPGWERTDMKAAWGPYTDTIFKHQFRRGRVEIPGNATEHKPGAYGMPHLAFVEAAAGQVRITSLPEKLGARLTCPPPAQSEPAPGQSVAFRIEVDARGDGTWKTYKRLKVPAKGYRFEILPRGLRAQWMRFTVDRDSTATAFFHYWSPRPRRRPGRDLFACLAGARDAAGVCAGLVRPAKHNRHLQFLARDGRYWEVNERMEFLRPAKSRAAEVARLAAIHRDFEVDAASAILTHRGRRYRLPKTHAAYDKPFAFGWPRGIRECVSERYLANIHGTFYEIPWEAGVASIKPVCTHGKQIMDFCTWRGLMVLSGARRDAKPDGQYFGRDGVGLWFGHIDDLWQLGKPRGVGGPWRKTGVTAGQPSDPYLMAGYDRKTLKLSHDSEKPVVVTVEVDVAGDAAWREYARLRVPAGQKLAHEFPDGYCAHWVRLVANRDCRATATFRYE